MFKRKDKYLIFHLAAKNSLELKRFVSRSKNKDKARKNLINLKYKLASLSPLLLNVVTLHSTMINPKFSVESSGSYISIDGMSSIYMVGIVVFECKRYTLTSARQDREWWLGKRVYLHSREISYEHVSIKTSAFEEDIMKRLINFNLENRRTLEEFKKNKKEYDIRNLNNV